MRIAVTGATGFLGRYIVARLAGAGHHCVCWHRPTSDLGHFDVPKGALTWIPGSLEEGKSADDLVDRCEAVVHAALERPGGGFIGSEGDLVPFVEANVVGTLRLIEAARRAGVQRFVSISTCAVYDVILGDRPLDEAHPLWPKSHYGAHKAALEAFVHSYGLGHGFPICALRPTGIYGLAHPPRKSKWYDLIAAVARGEDVEARRGGKEVHAADVAHAVELLLGADAKAIAGQSFNCCDRYTSEYEVATIAKAMTGSLGAIHGETPTPKHQIDTSKIHTLGMRFGGLPLLERTIEAILETLRTTGPS
ncbi:MAG: NAD(P)-dependent oxidoreductase [Isosphaeraceae bacterium]|nr:NAD(P)-dependent oxidoreductase [Isosphaeraceae bacterium]